MSRLERLIKLSQKTGDTLIVHDQNGRDMVVLDVDKYEMMHDMSDMYYEDEPELHEMSEREMLDKINRDIAIWRSHQEQDEQRIRDRALEDAVRNEPPFDPFEEDYTHLEDWHKAGDVLESKRSRFSDEVKVEDIPFGFDDDFTFDDDDEEEDLKGIDFASNDDISYTGIGDEQFVNPFETASEKKSVPFARHHEQYTKEEKLDDEPMFFEEPV